MMILQKYRDGLIQYIYIHSHFQTRMILKAAPYKVE